MFEKPSCALLVAGLICLFIGLVVGIRSLFIIRESQGRVRGYGHAILAIVCSLLTFPVVMVMMFMVGSSSARSSSRDNAPAMETEPQRASRASKDFDALVRVPPPPAWFNGPPQVRRVEGQMKPEDAMLLGELIDRVGIDDLEADQVVRWAVVDLREKGTDVPIQIWFAQLNADVSPMRVRRTWELYKASGRILMGMRGEQSPRGNETVERLADHYEKRLDRIAGR
ncbi:MAG TPA: hypothetical protein VFC86_08000 [Planctomycetota bacterium]|nr:hypothetical protein [Planctomycetota bacterium]